MTGSRLSPGWAANVVASVNDSEAQNVGLDAHLGHGERYDRADEFLDVAVGVWDTWPRIRFSLGRIPHQCACIRWPTRWRANPSACHECQAMLFNDLVYPMASWALVSELMNDFAQHESDDPVTDEMTPSVVGAGPQVADQVAEWFEGGMRPIRPRRNAFPGALEGITSGWSVPDRHTMGRRWRLDERRYISRDARGRAGARFRDARGRPARRDLPRRVRCGRHQGRAARTR